MRILTYTDDDSPIKYSFSLKAAHEPGSILEVREMVTQVFGEGSKMPTNMQALHDYPWFHSVSTFSTVARKRGYLVTIWLTTEEQLSYSLLAFQDIAV